jgi:hypothetical protein
MTTDSACPLCGSTAVWHRCLGAELPPDGASADRRIDVASEVADIRDGLADLQSRFERVMEDVRRLPGGEMIWQRVDAYPGIRLDRDMARVRALTAGSPRWPRSWRATTPSARRPPLRHTSGPGRESGASLCPVASVVHLALIAPLRRPVAPRGEPAGFPDQRTA